jgi:hypothetical protein
MKTLIFLLVVAFLLAVYAVYSLLTFKMKVKQYGQRLRNFYVFSEYPDDRTLVLRKKDHERWIERSGNQSGVKVVIIPYQDKDNPLESWEEYLVRRKEEQEADMIIRDNEIERKKGRDFFLSEVHQQDQKLDADLVDTLESITNAWNKLSSGTKDIADRLAAEVRRAKRRLQQH